MRKILLAMLATVMMAGMATSGFAAAVLEQSWDITVSLSALPIDLRGGGTLGLNFGNVGPDLDFVSDQTDGNPRCTVWNAGAGTVTYYAAVSITSTGVVSTLGNAVNPAAGSGVVNEYVLAGIFTGAVLGTEEPLPDGRDLVKADFATNDVIIDTGDNTSSTDNLARDNSNPDPDDLETKKGYSCPPTDNNRSLRFLLQTPPIAGSSTDPQVLHVIIGG